ncbi:hypothetical protein GI584_08500 [Gracilibacillus salitolerans]|uniref:Glycosyltransferase n=1 Tax=Gracilibacillus salitolerans TaxID=2663022 RepID=A0A5Q2TIT3_9BACI|nr:glycosyltransferase [Gracilibacillus salitolerans]QGH34057.1 hypothetical protein GI584_08500 [Gracilibacillus salitolerans]
MKKIVISIISNVLVKDEVVIQETYNFFSDEGYVIEQFLDNEQQIQVDQLPLIIDQIKSKYSEQDLLRVIVISNIRPLILSWFRCYNTIADDFVFLVNSDESIRVYENQLPIVNYLSEYSDNSISEEKLIGKIYINDFPIESGFGFYLFSFARYNYFQGLEHFEERRHQKNIIQKNYVYKNNEYFFFMKGIKERLDIKLDESHTKPFLNINKKLIALLEENPEFMIHLFVEISNLDERKAFIYDLLMKLIEVYSSFTPDKQINFYSMVKKYIKKSKIAFVDKMSFYNILVKLEATKDIILQDIISEIKQDKENIKYHYPLITNSLFYVSKERVEIYPEVINDRMDILERVLNYYNPKTVMKYNSKLKTGRVKKIAIITSQLLDIKHSPTLLALTVTKYLKKIDPSLEIKIYVDDMYIYCKEELGFPHMYTSINSYKVKQTHDEFLSGIEGIEVVYTNKSDTRKKTLQNEVSEVIDFNPDVIYLMGADFSLRAWELSKQIPTVVMNMTPEPSNFKYGHIYTAKHDVRLFESQLRKFNIKQNDRIFKKVIHGNVLPPLKKDYKRSDLGVGKNDFVIVTAGNRLDGDIDIDFINIIKAFLNKFCNVKWILIGNGNHKLIKRELVNEVNSRRIIFRSYEEDLQSIFKLCDLYVNPFCEGNGRIGRMAMNMYLPIVSHTSASDISDNIGSEYQVDKDKYLLKMIYYYENENARESVGKTMKEKAQANVKHPLNWAKHLITVLNTAFGTKL